MGQKMQSADGKTADTGKQIKIRDLVNIIVLALLFTGYALTFLVPKFYGKTDAYVGIFVFCMLLVLLFVNGRPLERIKNREWDLFLLLAALLLCGIRWISPCCCP